jgi:hypothetical protein
MVRTPWGSCAATPSKSANFPSTLGTGTPLHGEHTCSKYIACAKVTAPAIRGGQLPSAVSALSHARGRVDRASACGHEQSTIGRRRRTASGAQQPVGAQPAVCTNDSGDGLRKPCACPVRSCRTPTAAARRGQTAAMDTSKERSFINGTTHDARRLVIRAFHHFLLLSVCADGTSRGRLVSSRQRPSRAFAQWLEEAVLLQLRELRSQWCCG